MNPERDPTRIVRSWLESGVTDLPDRVLDTVLDQLPATPQRRHRWQARRSTRMNATLKIVTAAAAVVVVGVIGRNLLPGAAGQGVGAAPAPTPNATAAPSLAPSASPIPYLPASGEIIEPGRYRLKNLTIEVPSGKSRLMSLTIEVPAGWTVEDSDMIAKNRSSLDSDAGVLFALWPIAGTFVNPCTDHTLVQPTPGPGIDALAEALANQPGTEAAPPAAVMVDGYPGKVVDSTVTADIKPCGTDGFWLWAWPDGAPRYVQGTNELNRMFIVDVDGERITFNGRYPAGTTAADRAELDAIIASIDIEPTQPGVGAALTPAPSASPTPYLPTSGVIEPGRYRIPETQYQGASLTIEVPAGWSSLGSDLLSKDYGRGTEPGALFAAWPIAGTFVDPCTDHRLVEPTPGPGIDALADALANQPGTEAGPPTAVTVDGYPGKVVESTVTADIEPCGVDGFWLWAWPDGVPRYVQGTNEINRMYIVDVDGERLTFNGRIPATTTAADRAELEAIIASIDILP